jgi:Flp pilus assembly pilin Flp
MCKLQRFRQFVADRAAVTALEYGIVAAFFVVVLVAIFSSFGNTLTAMYTGVTSGL